MINLRVEFTGGLELLFSNQRKHNVCLPNLVSNEPADVTDLIHHLRDNLLTERREFFIDERNNDTVRPGILVLINDVDWELEGEGDYCLGDGDEIVFISTLHGG